MEYTAIGTQVNSISVMLAKPAVTPQEQPTAMLGKIGENKLNLNTAPAYKTKHD